MRNPRLHSILLTIMIFAFGSAVEAAVYQYEDENGSLHFTNVPTDPQYKMIVPPDKPKASKSRTASRKYRAEDFEQMIEDHAYRHGMDPKLVDAVIRVESEYNPRAVSRKGAQGLMQLMPETAKNLGVIDPFDPSQNIDGGIRYLRYLLDYFNWDLDLALAAYNAGINRVTKYRDVPPIEETQSYVRNVKKTYDRELLPPSSMVGKKPVRRTVSASGDIVFTNSPEGYLQ